MSQKSLSSKSFAMMVLTVLLSNYTSLILANDEIWLQDIDCKIIGPDEYSVFSKNASQITYICSNNNSKITCSTSAKNGSMTGGKPSTITTYQQMNLGNDLAIWKATSHEGALILNLQTRRYSVSQTSIIGEGLINKNCVGEIRNY